MLDERRLLAVAKAPRQPQPAWHPSRADEPWSVRARRWRRADVLGVGGRAAARSRRAGQLVAVAVVRRRDRVLELAHPVPSERPISGQPLGTEEQQGEQEQDHDRASGLVQPVMRHEE